MVETHFTGDLPAMLTGPKKEKLIFNFFVLFWRLSNLSIQKGKYFHQIQV